MRQSNFCQTLIYRATFCITCVLFCQPAPCHPWPCKLTALKVGTTRTEAEKMLALAHARPLFFDRWGSGQSDTYRLDSHWTVTIAYDYSSPQNKVTSLPVFVQEEERKR